MKHIVKHPKTTQLFLVLGAMYGELWQRQYKDARMSAIIKNLWACDIEKMELMEIEFGLQKCKESLELAPTLTQFLNKCKIEPMDINLEKDWRISFSNRDKTYNEIIKSFSYTDKLKPWYEYERVYEAKYKKHIENRLKLANEDKHLKLGIIQRIIGNDKQFLLTTN